jgi:hypothetical protein
MPFILNGQTGLRGMKHPVKSTSPRQYKPHDHLL